MARINVIQPSYGRITVTDSSESHYTVVYTATGAESFFNGFKVYCHACGRYVFQGASAGQEATINFTALQSDGHPGPFDISANEHEIEFLVETFSNDESMGTTTPLEKIMGVNTGGSVSFTITATAKTGYMFVKWVSVTTGREYTSSSQSITVHVNDVTDNYRAYVAYFSVRRYDTTCGSDYANHPWSAGGYPRFHSCVVRDDELSDYVQLRVRPEGSSTGYVDVNVAILSRSTTRAANGEQITCTVQLLPEAAAYGVVFLGWEADRYAAERGKFVTGTSITVTAYDMSGSTSNVKRVATAWFAIAEHSITVMFVRPEYYQVSSTLTARAWDGASTAAGEALSSKTPAASVFTWLLSSGDLGGKYLYIWWPGPTGSAVVHGTSSAECELGEFTVPGVGTPAAIRVTPDLSVVSEVFIVYLCTHALVCTDDGAHLECKPPELLYDCSVPPGTTVYD